MDTPVLPKPEYLTLPEAAALVCPPLSEPDARRAIEEALCDGRLSQESRPLWTTREAEQLVALAHDDEKDLIRAKAAWMLSPPPAPPTAWQCSFLDSRVDWQTGAVAGPKGGFEVPVFSRNAILALFAVPVVAEPERLSASSKKASDAASRSGASVAGNLSQAAPTSRIGRLCGKRLKQKTGRAISLPTLDRAAQGVWPDE